MIYLGADHGGFELKEKIKLWLTEWGMAYEDCGNEKYDASDDYPAFAFAVAKKVAKDSERNKGVLACRSAAGMVIAANKVKGIRAVSVFDEESAKHSRTNNDANVVALSGDWLKDDKAKNVLNVWLQTDFSHEERHMKRIEDIKTIELAS